MQIKVNIIPDSKPVKTTNRALLVRDLIEELYEEREVDDPRHVQLCLEYIINKVRDKQGDEKAQSIKAFLEYEELPESLAPILEYLEIDIQDMLEEMWQDYKIAEAEEMDDFLDLINEKREAQES